MNSINSTNVGVVFSPSSENSGITFIALCHVYGVVLKWLYADNSSTNNYSKIVYDNDIEEETGIIFSHTDCWRYKYLTKVVSSICVNNTMIHTSDENLKEGMTQLDYFRWLPFVSLHDRSGCKQQLLKQFCREQLKSWDCRDIVVERSSFPHLHGIFSRHKRHLWTYKQ